MSFADNLIYLRHRYSVTQEGLAEQLGVSRQTVSKWESGTNYPEMEKLLQICDLYHTNLDDLMRGSVKVAKTDDTERYDRHMNHYDALIAAATMLVLTGVGITPLLEVLGVSENLSDAGLLVFLAVAVPMFIVASLQHSNFKRLNPTIEPRYSDEVLARFNNRFPIMAASGVAILSIDIIMLVALSPDNAQFIELFGSHINVDILTAPFMFLIAVAIGLFIWAGLQKSKYELSELTYITHRRDLGSSIPLTAVIKTPEQVRVDHILGVICGIIMISATIVFLVWGFVPTLDTVTNSSALFEDGFDKSALKSAIKEGRGGFAVSWIAFAVGGLLCGIVYLIGSLFSKSKEDLIAEARQEDAWLKVVAEDALEDSLLPNGDSSSRNPASPQTTAPSTAQTKETSVPSKPSRQNTSSRSIWK